MEQTPIWTKDGRRIIYASDREVGRFNLWWQPSDGTGTADRLISDGPTRFPTAMTPDGKGLLFRQTDAAGRNRDVMYLRVGEANPPTPLVQTPFDDRNAVVSPDGRWLAYETNSSGRFEVYVRPFPGTDSGQWQVSNEGGVQPQWTRDGHELFYFAPDAALMRVPVEARDATWNAGKPVKALEGRYYTGGDNARLIGRQYDISPDGERFLMIKPPASGQGVASPIVVLNWQEELKRLVPVR